MLPFSSLTSPLVTIRKDGTLSVSSSSPGLPISTQLHEAFRAGDYSTCESILNEIPLLARVTELTNPTDSSGLSHLHIACALNKPRALRLLLDANFDPDLVANRESTGWYAGWNCGHFAAAFGAHVSLEELAYRGAQLFSRDSRGKTPLHYLILGSSRVRDRPNAGKALGVMLLRLEFRDEELTRETGLTALHAACLADRPDLVVRLFTYGDVAKLEQPAHKDCPRWPGYRPLHAAAKYAGVKTIKLLLEQGAELEARDDQGLTALQLACARGSVEIVELLMEHGAEPGARSPSRLTCFSLAKAAKSSAVMRLILAQGPDAACRTDKEGLTGFHYCCMRGWTAEAKVILEAGVPVETRIHPFARRFAGYTAVHLAAELGSPRLLEMMIKQGAALGLPDTRGRTALQIAEANADRKKRSGRSRVAEILRREGAPVKSTAGLANPEDENGHVMAVAFGHKEPAMIELDVNGEWDCAKELKLMPVQLRMLCSRHVMLRILFKYGAEEVVMITPKRIERTDDYKLSFRTLVKEPRKMQSSGAEITKVYYLANAAALVVLGRYGLQLDRKNCGLSDNFHICALDFFLEFALQLEIRTILGLKVPGLPSPRSHCPSFFAKLDEPRKLEFDELPRKIEAELKLLEETSCSTTGYNFRRLFSDRHALAMHMARGHGEFMDMLQTKNFDKRFPTIGGIVRLKYRMAQPRRSLLVATIPKIGWLVREGLKVAWPDVAADYVVRYLSDEDLQRILKV